MNTTILGSVILLGAAFATAQMQAPATPQASTTRLSLPRKKPAHYTIPNGWDAHTISVKFKDGLMVRLRDGALTDLGTNALLAAQPVLESLRVGTWSRMHAASEVELDRLRVRGESNVGFALHDLNLMFLCALPADVDAVKLIDALNALDCVEIAESVPGMAPAPQVPQVPDVRYKQGHAEPAPRGTGAGPFRGFCDHNGLGNGGASGIHSRIVDIEYGFDQQHSNLPPVTMLTPPGYSTQAYDDHGTAVLGILGSPADGIGTTGLAPAAQILFASSTATATGLPNIPNAISTAALSAGWGGVILIEQQIAGPHYLGAGTQDGLVPAEWYDLTWQTIQVAVATGITVVEAAGNGAENLDGPDYTVLVQPPVGPSYYVPWFSIGHDSGALMVGAGAAPPPSAPVPPTPPFAHSRLWFSNYGQTLDVQGWGESVVTTGYGDLYAAGGPHDSYTQVFGGTSSASAIVAGVCGLLQSRQFDVHGTYLMPAELRAALRRSGTPQTGATNENIGPLPDLMRTAVELRLYDGADIAHDFGPSFPGSGGNGLEFAGEQVMAMAAFDDDGPGSHEKRLYVAGQFSKLGGRFANNIAVWNGVGWQELGSGLGGPVLALAVHDADGSGPQLPQLYAGGLFPGGIARWNGISWSSVGSGLSPGGVTSLASIDEDGPGPLPPSLIAGGDFTNAGALAASHVARFRNNTWSAMGAGFDGRVNALEVYQGQLVAGGWFQHSAFVTTRSLAIWNGFAWSELGGTGVPGDQVDALEAIPIANSTAQYLFVGGSFFTMGGVPTSTPGLAVWNGGNWFMPATPAMNPFAIAGFEDGTDPQLPRQVDAFLSSPNGIYRLDLTTWVTTPLPVSTTLPACLLAFDEDGPGVEPPSLWMGGQSFAGPVLSVGVARHFGMVPVTNTGLTAVLPTGCGGIYQPTIAATGDPVLGAPFTVQYDCLPMSVPALCVGLPLPFPLPLCSGSGCAVGVDALLIDFGKQSATYTLANDPLFLGVTLAFQGIEFLALPYGPMCVPAFLPINLRTSDTLQLTF